MSGVTTSRGQRKKILIFEGLGCAGKTTLIRRLQEDLGASLEVEVLDNTHPVHTSILFSRNRLIAFKRGTLTRVFFRWTRILLFFDYILKSDSQLFLIDRGILTNYVYGLVDEVPVDMLLGVASELLEIIDGCAYRTVVAQCSLEEANRRLRSRQGIDLESKLERNELFEPYLNDLDEFPFLGELLEVETTTDVFQDYAKLRAFAIS